ncbi:MAG: RNA polymerase factor sigma-54, partial [Psychrobacter sp.]
MSMSFGLATTLSNSQKLTPQMQQAIKLLQLSSLELAQEVQAKLDSNPLLERIENDDEYDSGDDEIEEWSEPLTLDSWNQSSSDSFDLVPTSGTEYSGDSSDSFSDSLDKLQQPNIDDSAIDVDSYGSSDADSFDIGSFDTGNYASTATGSGNSRGDEDFDSYQGGTSSTIQDHVRWQLNFKRLSEADTLIAEYLIDSMDDMGFIRIDIDELLQSFDTMASFYQWDERVEKEEVLTVLRIIQSCDPVGVGARHLSECLSIQLSKLDAHTEYL